MNLFQEEEPQPKQGMFGINMPDMSGITGAFQKFGGFFDSSADANNTKDQAKSNKNS